MAMFLCEHTLPLSGFSVRTTLVLRHAGVVDMVLGTDMLLEAAFALAAELMDPRDVLRRHHPDLTSARDDPYASMLFQNRRGEQHINDWALSRRNMPSQEWDWRWEYVDMPMRERPDRSVLMRRRKGVAPEMVAANLLPAVRDAILDGLLRDHDEWCHGSFRTAPAVDVPVYLQERKQRRNDRREVARLRHEKAR